MKSMIFTFVIALAVSIIVNQVNADEIHEAAEKGNIARVKYLLDTGTDVNVKTNEGCTALMYAVLYGHTEIVKLFLQQPNIDVDSKNDYQFSALMYAERECDIEIVQLLLQTTGVDVNPLDQQIALRYAEQGRLTTFEQDLTPILEAHQQKENKRWRCKKSARNVATAAS